AETEVCQAVEARLDQTPVCAAALDDALGLKQVIIRNIRPAHYAAIKRLVDFQLIARSPLRFAHDPLLGAGAGCFADLLAGTTCRVTTLNAAHDPFFGGLNPYTIAKTYCPTAPSPKE